MNQNDPKQEKPPFYFLNLVSCVLGVLIILWFALGVEEQNSRAQTIFEWLLKRSTPIVAGLIGLMILILVGSYVGGKSLKDSAPKK